MTKITIDKTQSFKSGHSRDTSKLENLFRISPLAHAGTFDSAKKKAQFLNKQGLLVSLFNPGNFQCFQQNRDIWNSNQFKTKILQDILFYQIRAESPEGTFN